MNAEEPRWAFAGFVSPEEPDSQMLVRTGARWLGDDEAFLASPTASHYAIAIADPDHRRRLARHYDAAGLQAATLIHRTESIVLDVTIGPGSIVCAVASLTTNVQVGAHVHIDRAVTIGHDAVIEDFTTLHPASAISGAVHIGAGDGSGPTPVFYKAATLAPAPWAAREPLSRDTFVRQALCRSARACSHN